MDKRLSVEIGTHAGQEAMETIIRITETAPTNGDRILATLTAFGYVISKMEEIKTADPALGELVTIFQKLGKDFIAQRDGNG
jgi:hypothetical protein